MHLETWLHGILLANLEQDALFRAYMGNAALDSLSRADIEKYQFYHLRRTLHYVWQNSSFYKRQYQSAGISPEDIRNLGDLRKIPFTEPPHLSEEPYRFLCLSRASIARSYTFITSGTTGPHKKVFWTRNDMERIVRFMAAGIGTVANNTDVVQICLPDGRPYSQADLLARGVERIGARSVIADMSLSAQQQLQLLKKSESTVLFGYTQRLLRLTRELQQSCDLSRQGVRALFLAAEYLPDALRRELQEIWNCRIRTHYGLTEMGLGVAVECEAGNGYHFNEADLLLEVVDPETGHPVEAGQEGELVFTTLNREAMPLIRYRTRDISRLIPEPCPCGANGMLRFAAVKKRIGNSIVLNSGDAIYPTLFDDELFEVPGLVDYQVTILREGDQDRIDFKVELMPQSPNRILGIKNAILTAPVIAKNLKARTIAEPQVTFVEPGSLKTVSRAKKMIIDKR